MAKAQVFSLPKISKDPPILHLDPFKGMNTGITPTQISDNQSPDMLNMTLDIRGSLNKRTGYERVFKNALGAGNINGLFEFCKTDGTKEMLIAHADKLYRLSDIDV